MGMATPQHCSEAGGRDLEDKQAEASRLCFLGGCSPQMPTYWGRGPAEESSTWIPAQLPSPQAPDLLQTPQSQSRCHQQHWSSTKALWQRPQQLSATGVFRNLTLPAHKNSPFPSAAGMAGTEASGQYVCGLYFHSRHALKNKQTNKTFP